MKGNIFLHVVLSWLLLAVSADTEDTEPSIEVDGNGYLIFCLCMGRFGNQAEHFLGGLAFAKAVNRTLILPSWRTYKNIPFTDWFKIEKLAQYHRVILAEDFMRDLAPTVWPPGQRTGFCFSFDENTECKMKEGNPFGPFWDELGVNFDSMKAFTVAYHEPERWVQRFSPSEYPVVALKGAPASFPMATEHRALQQYMEWSDSIVEQGQRYIQQNFPGRKYVGIHLRNGPDWEKACGHLEGGLSSFMASPQCINPRSSEKVTQEICFPSTDIILSQIKEHVEETGATVVYVATDKNPLIHEIGSHLADLKVSVFHQDPWLPQLDLYILGEADHFIGNCVSSFTSFVARARTVHNKPTSFWAVR
ncbi:GDP-fucose protein O-fucosyltransferase 1-like [Mya arenaria]|uniref:GDP-fucose protein O-fucosyltransferase 1-like n=1 Tax=Mya arenaria TaxID=6604 RepID=UPI0022DFBF15|nr:GDP-fucose protein O-fucosyltransferase 1-like [Mya arenaria]